MNRERWKIKERQKDAKQKSLISFLSVKPRRLSEPVKSDEGNKNSSLGKGSECKGGDKRSCPFYKKIPGW